MTQGSHQIIDTAPASHIYTGGLLCNLQDPGSELRPDYICGEFASDGSVRRLNRYHWNAAGWRRTILSDVCAYAVGMDAADLTGNGKADLVAVEWPLGEGGDDRASGHVYWFEQPDDPFGEPWPRHLLAPGWARAHDLHIGDIGGAGRPDVVVRLKDETISWLAMGDDPRQPWRETPVTDEQIGDGTALYDVTGTGSLDIVTGAGFYENVDGDGSRWVFHEFTAAKELGLDAETRVAVQDAMGDGSVTVAIAESEILTNARLVLLHSGDNGTSWQTKILIDGRRDLGALHSLQFVDVDGDGRADIFTAEMELYKEETGIDRRPTWKVMRNRGDLVFDEHTVLDVNLGGHQGAAGRISRADGTDFVAKNWLAHSRNACEGINHVVHVTGWSVEA